MLYRHLKIRYGLFLDLTKNTRFVVIHIEKKQV